MKLVAGLGKVRGIHEDKQIHTKTNSPRPGTIQAR